MPKPPPPPSTETTAHAHRLLPVWALARTHTRHRIQKQKLAAAVEVAAKTLAGSAFAASIGIGTAALAAPDGLGPASGLLAIQQNGSVTQLTTQAGAILNWTRFNIAEHETVRFIQPSAAASVLNRVTGPDPSQIFGQLQSNGRVFLINPHGIVFGPHSQVDVNGLVASTLAMSDSDFLAGRLRFGSLTSPPSTGAIHQQGHLQTPKGGSVYLLGSNVSQSGLITSPAGTVLLAAGQTVELSESAQGHLSVRVQAPEGSALNLGQIGARGGQIHVYGALVKQQGELIADSANVDEQGRIVLRASGLADINGRVSARNADGRGGDIQITGERVELGAAAHIDVSGHTGGGRIWVGGGPRGREASLPNARLTTLHDQTRLQADAGHHGDGGQIVVYAREQLAFRGTLSARGGQHSGRGGWAETSAGQLSIHGRVDVGADRGARGQWLIDPRRICIFAIQATECAAGTNAFNQAGLFNDSPGGGASSDTLVSIADLNQAAVNAELRIEADQLISILPSGGVWTLTNGSGDPGSATFVSPLIFLNGTLRNIAGNSGFSFGSNQGLVLDASNVFAPANPAASQLGLSNNTIVLGSGAHITSDFQQASVRLGASHYRFENGSRIALSRPSAIAINGATTAVVFRAGAIGNLSTMHNEGLHIQAERYDWIPDGRWQFTGTPLSLDVRHFNLNLTSDLIDETLRISSDCTTGALLCGTALNQWSTGSGAVDRMTIRVFESELASTVFLGALPSLPAGVMRFLTEGDIRVTAPISRTAGDLTLHADRQLAVDPNASVRISDGSLTLSALRSIRIDAPLEAAHTLSLRHTPQSALFGTGPFGIVVGANLTAARILADVNTDSQAALDGSFLSTPNLSAARLQFLPGVTVHSNSPAALAQELIDGSMGPIVRTQAPAGIFARVGQQASLMNDAGASVFSVEGASQGWQISTATSPADSGVIQAPNGLESQATATPTHASAATAVCGDSALTNTQALCNTRAVREFEFSAYSHIARNGATVPAPPPTDGVRPPPGPTPPGPTPPGPTPPGPTPPGPTPPGPLEPAATIGASCLASPLQCGPTGAPQANAPARHTLTGALPLEGSSTATPARITLQTPLSRSGEHWLVQSFSQMTQPSDPARTRNSVAPTQWQVKENPDSALQGLTAPQASNPSAAQAVFSRLQLQALSMPERKALLDIRRSVKSERFSPALAQLRIDSARANLPRCDGTTDVCIPASPPRAAGIDSEEIMRLPQRKRALVVGIDHYADSQIPSLETARADAIAVSRQLQRIFSYDVHTLLDPERADIVKALKQLATEASPNDTVTLYFAGHGYRDEQTGNGYWIPADAQARSPERWLSNNDIAALLGQIPARQILVVSDSCFSGSLVRDLASNTTLTRSPVSALSQRTVIALSSGGDEPVSDEGANGHSVFAEQFMRVLDRVTGLDVSSRVYSAVRNAVSQQLPQTPQYSRVTSPLHPDGGDYVIQTGQGSRQRP